jgi:ABC-2 type transport system ATP-binding protein
MGGDALTTEGLGKRYRRVWALRDCTLALPSGAVVGLVGPNGAGKTTLLRLVVGLIEPTVGTVAVFGDRSGANTAAGLARVGFVAQEHPLYGRFTVADLLRLGRALNLTFDQQLAARRLHRLDIDLARRADALSGGQRAQVALALALAKRPRLLVLDEPLASLDPLARREFLQTLMGAVAEDGVTVLFSSHVVGELERVCDHLVLLAGGRVRLAGEVEHILAGHRTLVGPRCGDRVDRAPGVVRVTHSDRHTSLLVHAPETTPAPGWQAHPVELEELILAYLADTRSGDSDDRQSDGAGVGR